MFHKQFSLFCVMLLLGTSLWMPLTADSYYDVELIGIHDPKAADAVQQVSQLLTLANRRPISLLALKRRSELDVDLFIKAMQACAYYNAKIDFSIDVHAKPVRVIFTFDIGEQYPFHECLVSSAEDGTVLPLDIGVTVGDIAYAEKILDAEERLLHAFAANGYAYAAIQKRDVVADQKKKGISLKFSVSQGPLVRFGAVTIRGNDSVGEEFIRGKMAWQEGDIYDPELVERTRDALESTGLFSSTSIALPATTEESLQPVDIQVTENKQRTISAGVSYTTQLGAGTSLEWEHRNAQGAGQRINAALNLWQIKQEAKLSYTLPDFGSVGQNLIWSAAVDRELTKGYHQTSLKLSGMLERNRGEDLKIGYGAMYQALFASHSTNNGTFHLLKIPLSLRWSRANSLLDPTKGYTLNCKITPSVQIGRHPFAYCPMTLTSTFYHPLTTDERLVFAAKATVGTICGASRRAIPPSELFYAGSENGLRGYRYLTVSPLNSKGKPTGGKSIGILSFETRYRLNDKLGLVGFYEVGNVFASPIIQFKSKQLQSVGAGIRYHTPVGPIRFDVALPLNKRKGIDSNYQLYMSIGQSF